MSGGMVLNTELLQEHAEDSKETAVLLYKARRDGTSERRVYC